MLIARNTMFPATKNQGMAALPKPLVLFTSTESHYSISSAAASLGIGASHVRAVPVDESGAMLPSALECQVSDSLASGQQPFYVCATAGTTVRGAYDPLTPISEVCQKHNLWLHVDGCWGGPAIFSARHAHKLAGSGRADSVACNPHKMMGVPLTCSFLLGRDLRAFHAANALTAGYLFHEDLDDADSTSPENRRRHPPPAADVYDLASLTPQCGRRGDGLKLYLSWTYHGSAGYAAQIDAAFAAAAYMAARVRERADMRLVGESPPPCCQVCFYYVGSSSSSSSSSRSGSGKGGAEAEDGEERGGGGGAAAQDAKAQKRRRNSRVTRGVVAALEGKGWMVDYAPGERGEFLRVVVNRNTTRGIVDGFLIAVGEVGERVVAGSAAV